MGLALLVVAAVATAIVVITGHRTDCYADFRSKQDAERALAQAEAAGFDDTDLVARRRTASIRFTSGKTGDDAQEFRQSVKQLVREGGGHMEKNTPCLERSYFD